MMLSLSNEGIQRMPLKVLHVIPSLSPLRGGTTTTALALVKELARTGVDVHVATTDDDGPDAHLNVPLAQPCVCDGVTYWYFHRQTRFYTFSWPLTHWLFKYTRNYDVVDIHAVFSYPSLAAAWCAWQINVPYLWRPQGMLNHWGIYHRRPWLKKLSLWLLERHLFANAARIQFTCHHERAQAEELGIHTPSVLIPLPLDLTPFEQLPQPGKFRARYPSLANKTLFLFLSRLDQKKGIELLLSAFAEVRQQLPDTTLVLAGSGEKTYEEAVREMIRSLDIEQDVCFTGFLQGEEKIAALIDSDVFVLPSHSENFGLAVVEAMASNLPVIISDQVGVAQDITQWQAGLVVPRKQDRLVAAMLQLATNNHEQQRLVANAQHLVWTQYKVDVVARSLMQVYGNIAKRTPAVKSILTQ
jgi:glycosyltransferase involved in cell wall biosynthesis